MHIHATSLYPLATNPFGERYRSDIIFRANRGPYIILCFQLVLRLRLTGMLRRLIKQPPTGSSLLPRRIRFCFNIHRPL